MVTITKEAEGYLEALADELTISPLRPGQKSSRSDWLQELYEHFAAVRAEAEESSEAEINDAIELGKVCLVPCGAVEQHGPHLPLDVDLVCPLGVAHGAGREIPAALLVLLDVDPQTARTGQRVRGRVLRPGAQHGHEQRWRRLLRRLRRDPDLPRREGFDGYVVVDRAGARSALDELSARSTIP